MSEHYISITGPVESRVPAERLRMRFNVNDAIEMVGWDREKDNAIRAAEDLGWHIATTKELTRDIVVEKIEYVLTYGATHGATFDELIAAVDRGTPRLPMPGRVQELYDYDSADDLLELWADYAPFLDSDMIKYLFGYIPSLRAKETNPNHKQRDVFRELETLWWASGAYRRYESPKMWEAAEEGWRRGVAGRAETPRYLDVEKGPSTKLGDFMASFSTSSAEMTQRVGKPEWIMTDVLEVGTYNRLVGRWGHGKTMMQVGQAAAVATGRDWMGHPTRKGVVVYMACEGGADWAQRLRAWEQVHNDGESIPAEDLRIIHQPVNVDDAEKWSLLVQACRYWGADWIIFDTQAKITRGIDEQGPSLSVLNQAVDKLRMATGAAVTLLHHPGHSDEPRGRGWSGISPELDTEWYLSQDKSGKVTVKSIKVRTGRKSDTIEPMRIVEVATGDVDDDGTPLAAGLMIPWEAPAPVVVDSVPVPAAVTLPDDVLSYDGKGSSLVPRLAAYVASQGGSSRAAALRGIDIDPGSKTGREAWDFLRSTDHLKVDNTDANEATGFHRWIG
jgi:hypothetical protein